MKRHDRKGARAQQPKPLPRLLFTACPPAGARFTWPEFERFFPFGDLGPSEAEYEALVLGALDCLATTEERNRLMDLLDTQWCVLLEQLWVQNEHGEPGEGALAGKTHFAAARIQINYNIRWERGLRYRDVRSAMLGLHRSETLLDRIIRAGRRREASAAVQSEADGAR